MDRTMSLIELFCQSFPEIDRRVVKATVIECGDDIESAITDLVDISDEKKDASFLDYLKVQCCSVLNPSEDRAEQVSIKEEETSQAVAVPPVIDCKQISSPIDINMLPDASDLQTDVGSAHLVEDSSSVDAKIAEPLAMKGGFKPEKLANSIDIVNVASTLECTVQEARTDIDDVINLVKEVSDLRVKAEQERMTAQNAEIEAARGGEDLLMKACEVNKQTQKMKQDNVKLSWEIHGEKSVLALEVEELSVHLEQMKQQKEKVVTTLHELRDTLQSCYDIAHEERKMAEEDKKLKEEKAGKVLEQEEEQAALVEQETKTLKMEAETCNLLRDFLADHGSIVDALQGEINNLSEDVKDLKEQVQGMWASMNVAKAKVLAQNAEAPYNLRRSSSSLSAVSSGEMSAGQYMDTKYRGKPQFLFSSGTHAPTLSRPFDGTLGDGSFSYMNGDSSSNNIIPGHELPFTENSYHVKVPGLLPFSYGAGHQHPAHGEHGDASVDPIVFSQTPPYRSAFNAHVGDFNGYGYPQEVGHPDNGFAEHEGAPIDLNNYHYPQMVMPDWSWKLDHGRAGANYVGTHDWVLASKDQGSTPSGSENFSLV